jgi:endonuclease/exonuclease/phosphatase family metal-dependent hydrolase
MTWLARASVLAVVVPASVLSFVYKTGIVSTWWLELAQYVPYPVYLLPAIVALGLSFLLGWRWRLAAAGGLVLVVTVLMGLVLGQADAGVGRVRLMTYNVKAYLVERQSGSYAPLAWEVALHDPDILLMQDAERLSERRREVPDTATTVFKGRHVFETGQYIVVSRFPLRDCRVEQIPYRGESHTYVRCVVQVNGVDVDLVNVHLKSPREGLNAARHEQADGIGEWQQNFADRLGQATQLAADISGRQRPLILAGDLNAPESSPVLHQLLGRGLRDAFSSAGWGYGYTHGHSLKPRISFLRIDHILVSSEIGVTDSYAGGKDASDHRPVIADLLLAREPG